MDKISIVNLSKNKIEECNNFALNFSTALAQHNKKVLLVATDFAPAYLSQFNINVDTITKTKVIPPFVLYKVNSNLHLLLLVLPELKNQIKSTDDLANALVKQMRVFKEDYDYLVVSLNNKWEDLDNSFNGLKEDSRVYYFNAFDVNTNSFTNLKLSDKSYFVLDQYVGDNKNHMQAYSMLNKILKKNELIVLYESEEIICYQRKEPKSLNSTRLLAWVKKSY